MGPVANLNTRTLDRGTAPASTSEQARRVEPPEYSSAEWPSAVVGGPLKRVFDLIGALTLLAFLAPVFAIVALMVKLGDGGAVFYSQTRIGFGGRRFSCFKFRSMAVKSDEILRELLASNPAAAREWAVSRKLRDDPRVTAVGKFLRKSSLDELPQLLNVVQGTMSLIGPRPVSPEELARYGLARVHYMRTRPGMTGLWQISGRSNTSYKRRIELDKSYVLKWSFMGDLSILARTLPAVTSGAV